MEQISLQNFHGNQSLKQKSTFFPANLRELTRANTTRNGWAKRAKLSIIKFAEQWKQMSDDELWELMFGNTITRSWHVWSNGYCPACKQSVPMYAWQINALKQPWKVRCPHCSEFFPKNDFYKFYRSGLDEHGIFDRKLADRTLLFNTEHPNLNDPRHEFGVDNGEGYLDGGKRWRFIGAYLVWGQWKQMVHGGIKNLAAAYVVTGDPLYAHKAGVLLDRVADLYPTFDFHNQALTYETPGGPGYVSVWHDACEETRELALAYDAVFEALRDDDELVRFLSRKAQEYKTNRNKTSFANIQHNIEQGIICDALNYIGKIRSNYPRTPLTKAILLSVLSWQHYRDKVVELLDMTVQRATAVDGLTGVKGLSTYSAIVIQSLASALALFSRVHPNILCDMLQRHPRLCQTYRFHVDTWCLQQYYPRVGDSELFAARVLHYVGVRFIEDQEPFGLYYFDLLAPSMYDFLWQLYVLTGDIAFVQVLYHQNNDTVDGLPHDLFAKNPKKFQKAVHEAITEHGSALKLGSVNKPQWCLAILRSGEGNNKRAVWLNYGSGGGHGHQDGMNLGLFAKGLDLMPDFGYPPVQYGTRKSPRAKWYMMTAAHNTVRLFGKDNREGLGQTTLWGDGKQFHVVRASAPNQLGAWRLARQYERTVALVDLSPHDFYVIDIFRVAGHVEHDKFMHSHFGTISTKGLFLDSVPEIDYGKDAQMRHFLRDSNPQPGWSVDWKIEDRYGYLQKDTDLHLRYTDLTLHAQVYLCEGWVSAMGKNARRAYPTSHKARQLIWGTLQDAWIPRVIVRRLREREAPLVSAFVAVIEPYEHIRRLATIKRMPLETPQDEPYPDTNVAVEIVHQDGKRDIIVSMDAENPWRERPDFAEVKSIIQKEYNLQTDASLCFVRMTPKLEVERMVLCQGTALRVGETTLALEAPTEFIEVNFKNGKPSVVSGNPASTFESIHHREAKKPRVR